MSLPFTGGVTRGFGPVTGGDRSKGRKKGLKNTGCFTVLFGTEIRGKSGVRTWNRFGSFEVLDVGCFGLYPCLSLRFEEF